MLLIVEIHPRSDYSTFVRQPHRQWYALQCPGSTTFSTWFVVEQYLNECKLPVSFEVQESVMDKGCLHLNNSQGEGRNGRKGTLYAAGGSEGMRDISRGSTEAEETLQKEVKE